MIDFVVFSFMFLEMGLFFLILLKQLQKLQIYEIVSIIFYNLSISDAVGRLL